MPKLNILIVDDSPTIRSMIEKTLQIAGIELDQSLHAANGKEALDQINNNWIDLIFLDINMPVMNGVELVEKMAEDGLMESIPVVIISTEGSETRIESLRKSGITAYLRKPFKPEDIKNIVLDITGEQQNAA